MEVRIAKWADVESVLARLSDQHRREYEKTGYPNPAFMRRMAAFMATGDTKMLWFDDKPQAILSICYNVTWLACTKEFFEKGLASTRAARRYMKDAVKRHGPIKSYVGSDHPQTAKWMKAIGFEQVDGNIFLYNP